MPPLDVFFAELARRRVVRAAVAYAICAWVVIQVADTTLPALGAPDWVLTAVILAALLGCPVVLAMAWAFEVTGGSLRRTAGGPTAAANVAVWSLVVVVIAAVVAAGALLVRTRAGTAPQTGAPPATTDASIAVLPFADLSPEGEQTYFAAGLAEELLSILGHLEGLRVAGRASSFAMDGASAVEVGERLGVATILTGSVRPYRDSLRVTVELAATRDGMQLWTETYQRAAEDVFAVQDEIAAAVANALELRLLDDAPASRRARASDPEAYRAYLRGRHAWNERTEDGLLEALEHFGRAVAIDPGYALGHAGLADTYMVLDDLGALDRDEAFAKGAAAARRALQIDERLAEAHTSLAHILMHQRQYEASAAEFGRALELNPSFATAHQWYALLLLLMGRGEEADLHAGHSVGLDPVPMAPQRTWAVAAIFTRRPDVALVRLDSALAHHPGHDGLQDWQVKALLQAGRRDAATRVAEELVVRFPDSGYYRSLLAYAYGAAGRAAAARRVLADLPSGEPRPNVALALAHMGDMDDAFQVLHGAIAAQNAYLDFMPIDPVWDPMRSDPRWPDALRRAGHD